MSLLRSTAIRFGNAIPHRWKRHIKWQLSIPDAGASLELLKRRGFMPTQVLDIGSFVGSWTRMCKQIWPQAQICMFEPQPARRAGLEQLAASLPGVSVRSALLSDVADQEVTFNLSESGSSSLALLAKPHAPTIRLRTQRLSDVVAGTPFASPQMIKVDVQGAELKVLEGGTDVLEAAEVVMLEVALIAEYAGGPLFSDVVAYMAEKHFVVNDICTIFRNTPTQTMNEADVIFVRRGSRLHNPG